MTDGFSCHWSSCDRFALEIELYFHLKSCNKEGNFNLQMAWLNFRFYCYLRSQKLLGIHIKTNSSYRCVVTTADWPFEILVRIQFCYRLEYIQRYDVDAHSTIYRLMVRDMRKFPRLCFRVRTRSRLLSRFSQALNIVQETTVPRIHSWRSSYLKCISTGF
jgi:hypothetical protein